ncbi:MDR family MFS transporter [Paenibacillus flagellatus]|uniref:MDR family MFS transporter n=1 Tax=Paenibacillus flagellatus TaxID=2211139 RepID=UPI001FEABE53|nr:MFS transporter [Paenibacillus flagellatus]
MIRLRLLLSSFHPVVSSLLLGTVFARAAASMSLPFLAIYLTGHTDLGPAAIGLAIGAGSLAGTFGGFVGGSLSDRIGRKAVMLVSLYGWGFVFIGFAFAEGFWPFLLLSMANGLCRSFYEPVSQALMADLTEKDKRYRVFSLRYTAINIGVAVGPLLGAYIGLVADGLPFVVTGVVYFVYAASLHALLNRFGIRRIEGEAREPVTMRASWTIVVRDAALRYFLLGSMIIAVGYSQMTVTLSQVAGQRFADGAALFAVLMSVNAVVVIALQLPLSRWSERRPPLQSLALGAAMYALGDVGFAYANGWAAMIAAMVVFTLGEILTFPAGSVLIDRIAPERLRGAYFGAQTFQNAGHFVGPWLGGLLLAEYGGTVMFNTIAAITLTAVLFYRRGSAVYEAKLRDDRSAA